MQLQVQQPIAIYQDNQACIALTKDRIMNANSKLFAKRTSFLRETATLEITYKDTSDMTTDLLTKAFDKAKVDKFRNLLGLADGGVLENQLHQ